MFELWCIWDFLRRSNTCVLQGEKISKVLQIGHLRLIISILCQLAPSDEENVFCILIRQFINLLHIKRRTKQNFIGLLLEFGFCFILSEDKKIADCFFNLRLLCYKLLVNSKNFKKLIKVCENLEKVHNKSLYKSKDVAVLFRFCNFHIVFVFCEAVGFFISESSKCS